MLTPYNKTIYLNDQAPPLDETNLNNNEEGLEAVTNEAITLDNRVTDLEENAITPDYVADSVGMAVTGIALQLRPTGFDLRVGQEDSIGTLEYCISASSGELYVIDQNQQYTKLTAQTTFGDGTTPLSDRTFAIRPSDAQTDFSYYYNGVKNTVTTIKTIQHPLTADKHIIAFNEAGNLVLESGVYDAIMIDVIVSVITMNPITNGKVIFANERHGLQMDSTTHKMMHETQGAVWSSGIDINGLTNNGDTFSSVSSGVIYDEDIKHSILEVTTAPFMYRTGLENWNASIPDNKLGYQVGGKVQYNLDTAGVWSLEDIGSDYLICHFYATNDGEYPIAKVIGQKLYASRNDARDNIFSESMNINSGSLPTPEFLHIGCMIIHNESVGQIETGTDGEIWLDCRLKFPIVRH